METRPERLPRWRVSSNGFLCAVVILLSFLVLSYSVHRWFDHDEFEHVHSAWYVANGYTPYADFFENHHPLLWYCMAPVLFVLGYSTQTVVVLGMVMFGLTMGIAFLTFLIARRVTSSTMASLLSVLLLLSMVVFVEKSIEIRPDVPQVLLGLVSVYFLVCFLQTREVKHLVLAGLTASFSFLFLQKTVFLFAAYVAILSYELLRRRLPVKSALYFFASLSMPILLFLGYLVTSGSLTDYVLTSWLVNMYWIQTFSPLRHLGPSFLTQNALFWLLTPVSVAFILLNRKTSSALKVTVFLGLALLFSVLLVRLPLKQYYLFAIPLLCIAIGYLLERILLRFRLRGLYTALVLVVVFIQPLSFLVPRSIESALRDQQLSQVKLVIDNTTEYDPVYDGNIQFNLYRPDVHYYWFSVGEAKGLDTYNLITNGRYADYDVCQLLKSKRPRFISDYELDMTACGLQALYDETKYDGLYMLQEPEGVEHSLWRDFGGVATLLGYGVEEVGGPSGQRLVISLWWQALTKMDRDYTVFIHVVDRDGRICAQQDTLLLSAERPTSKWRAGETVKQQYDLALPTGVPADFTILVGVYYWHTGERLPVWDEFDQRVTDDVIILAPEGEA